MELNPQVVLMGKYVILNKLFETEYFFAYNAKAPAVGEEFVITEFFPKAITSRDEEDSIVVQNDKADFFENLMNQIVSSTQRATRLNINSCLHITESFSENGTFYVVTKPVSGMSLLDRISMGYEIFTLDDPICKSLYKNISECARKNVLLDFSAENLFVTDSGSFLFRYSYSTENEEYVLMHRMARLFYLLAAGREPMGFADKSLLNSESIFAEIITGILSGNSKYTSFSQIDRAVELERIRIEGANKFLFGAHFKTVIIFMLCLLAVVIITTVTVYIITRLVILNH